MSFTTDTPSNSLTDADIASIRKFQSTMVEEVIPEIVESLYRRCQLADESRKKYIRI
jgi:hypothetical protein